MGPEDTAAFQGHSRAAPASRQVSGRGAGRRAEVVAALPALKATLCLHFEPGGGGRGGAGGSGRQKQDAKKSFSICAPTLGVQQDGLSLKAGLPGGGGGPSARSPPGRSPS